MSKKVKDKKETDDTVSENKLEREEAKAHEREKERRRRSRKEEELAHLSVE